MNSIDFRDFGLTPLNIYDISDGKSDEYYGRFKIGEFGTLHSIGKLPYGKTKTLEKINKNVYSLIFRKVGNE